MKAQLRRWATGVLHRISDAYRTVAALAGELPAGLQQPERTVKGRDTGHLDALDTRRAPALRDPTGRAYNRTAHLTLRRAMMQKWADYLDRQKQGADIIPLRPATAS